MKRTSKPFVLPAYDTPRVKSLARNPGANVSQIGTFPARQKHPNHNFKGFCRRRDRKFASRTGKTRYLLPKSLQQVQAIKEVVTSELRGRDQAAHRSNVNEKAETKFAEKEKSFRAYACSSKHPHDPAQHARAERHSTFVALQASIYAGSVGVKDKEKSSAHRERDTRKSERRVETALRTRRPGRFPLTQTHARYLINRRRKEVRSKRSPAVKRRMDQVGCVVRESRYCRHQPVRRPGNLSTHRNTGGCYAGI